jgi:hypothetical protein
VNISGTPGAPATSTPTVVVRDQSGARIRGVAVTFEITDGGGSVVTRDAVSDTAGQATCGKWVLGPEPGTNTVRASIAGIPLSNTAQGASFVFFSAIGSLARVTLVFDLVTIGGRSLPDHYSGGGTSWDVVGGRYMLYADGTYMHEYFMQYADGSTRPWTWYGSYQTLPAGFGFGGVFERQPATIAVGALSSDVLTVTYLDLVDFETEVYRTSK